MTLEIVFIHGSSDKLKIIYCGVEKKVKLYYTSDENIFQYIDKIPVGKYTFTGAVPSTIERFEKLLSPLEDICGDCSDSSDYSDEDEKLNDCNDNMSSCSVSTLKPRKSSIGIPVSMLLSIECQFDSAPNKPAKTMFTAKKKTALINFVNNITGNTYDAVQLEKICQWICR